jgi:hypothetical protein
MEHKMCVLIFSTTFVWNISHSKKNSRRYYHKCAQVFMSCTPYSCHILMKLEFSRHIFEKKSTDIKFHENSSSGRLVVPCGRTWLKPIVCLAILRTRLTPLFYVLKYFVYKNTFLQCKSQPSGHKKNTKKLEVYIMVAGSSPNVFGFW